MVSSEQRLRRQDVLSFDDVIGGASFKSPSEYQIVTQGLITLDARPSLPAYLRDLWGRRHFIKADARGKAFQSARDYRLGKIWLVLNPLLGAAMYGVIFGLLLQTSRGIENFIGYLVIGITFFGILSSGLNGGLGLIRQSRAMINSFHFPRAALVISKSLRTMLDTIPAAVVAIIMALAMQYREPLHWTLVFVPVLFVLMNVFGTGLMFLTARLTASVPDAAALMSLVQRAWFYLSGVFFSIDRFAHLPTVMAIMEQNPGYMFLMALRDSAIYGNVPDARTWLLLCAWSFGTLLIGLVVFWKAEEIYGRVN